MDNRYISKFATYDTQFHRTDPWRHIPWEDQPPSKFRKVLAGAGFILVMACLLGFSYIAQIVSEPLPQTQIQEQQICINIKPNVQECTIKE